MTRRYVAWRLAQLLPTCAGIVLLGFVLVHIAPGDPVLALAGDSGDAAYYDFMRAKFGLDKPLGAQLVTYAGNVIRGDFGVSYVHGRSVVSVIADRLPATLLLTGSALVLSSFGGVAVALLAASRPGRLRDVTVNTAALALYAAPVFFVAQLAVLFFSLRLGWFPVQGLTDARHELSGLAYFGDVAHHLVLPALVLASQEIAAVSRLARAGLLEELATDHIRTARAKGVPERTVLMKHALRRALLPVITVIGSRIGHLVAGAVVVEAVFGWPGIGQLTLAAIQNRDIPIVLGTFSLVAVAVVVANLITDLSYGWLDPRIRYR